jgi:hypothetical protein
MRGDESRITSLRVRGKLTDKADVAWRPLGGSLKEVHATHATQAPGGSSPNWT